MKLMCNAHINLIHTCRLFHPLQWSEQLHSCCMVRTQTVASRRAACMHQKLNSWNGQLIQSNYMQVKAYIVMVFNSCTSCI